MSELNKVIDGSKNYKSTLEAYNLIMKKKKQTENEIVDSITGNKNKNTNYDDFVPKKPVETDCDDEVKTDPAPKPEKPVEDNIFAGTIKEAYEEILGRKEDESGFNAYTRDMKEKGLSEVGLAESMLKSKEYKELGHSNEETVEIMYEFLDKECSDKEKQKYVEMLNDGASIDEVIESINGTDKKKSSDL